MNDPDTLPDEVREKLAELDLELSEGDITKKGYDKKRDALLAPFKSLRAANGKGYLEFKKSKINCFKLSWK